MKKLFVAFLALIALGGIFSGITNFIDIVFLNNSTDYNIGHNVGVAFKPIFKILFALFILKNCYKWFQDEEIEKS